jgi:hypothetical protein
MRNLLRMYICEMLLHFILLLTPPTEEGVRLAVAIHNHIINEFKINFKK